MLSKMVVDREASARAVQAALQTHGAVAAEAVAALLKPHVASGEISPDRGQFIALVSRYLAAENAKLVKADETHIAERGDDVAQTRARDEAAAALYGTITDVRSIYTRRFGEDFGGTLGVKGPTPSDPASLYSFASNVINAIEAAPAGSPSPDDLVTVDRDKALALLRQRRELLGQRLSDVAQDKRENEATQLAKDRAMQANDFAFAVAASFAEVFLRTAGQPELADKVRPSRRRPGQTAASVSEADPEPAPQPTPEPDPA